MESLKNSKICWGGVAHRLIDWIYPVGHVIATVNPDYDPNKLFKTHTWERFAKGQTLIGVNEDDTDFRKAGETGGEKTHLLTVAEMPSHTHNVVVGSQQVRYQNTNATASNQVAGLSVTTGLYLTAAATGGNAAHNNLQPYTTVYYWKRIV